MLFNKFKTAFGIGTLNHLNKQYKDPKNKEKWYIDGNTLTENYIYRSVGDCVFPEYLLSVIRDSEFTLCGTKVPINKMENKREKSTETGKQNCFVKKNIYLWLCISIYYKQ